MNSNVRPANIRVNLTGRRVTRLVRATTCTPRRPAGYAERSVMLMVLAHADEVVE